jgi:hypothetical protein
MRERNAPSLVKSILHHQSTSSCFGCKVPSMLDRDVTFSHATIKAHHVLMELAMENFTSPYIRITAKGCCMELSMEDFTRPYIQQPRKGKSALHRKLLSHGVRQGTFHSPHIRRQPWKDQSPGTRNSSKDSASPLSPHQPPPPQENHHASCSSICANPFQT